MAVGIRKALEGHSSGYHSLKVTDYYSASSSRESATCRVTCKSIREIGMLKSRDIVDSREEGKGKPQQG